jgi:NADP-dependent aldehyde dehydrogenase
VIKAHSSHPALSVLTFRLLQEAAESVGAPKGLLGLVFGLEAGASLVAHPAIKAVGFTGSQSGGRALLDIVNRREEPIPFYGELSGLNPVVITRGSAAARAESIARELVTSVTGSAGQLCTKPGLVLVPGGVDGDRLVAEAARLISELPTAILLDKRVHSSFATTSEAMRRRPGVELLAQAADTGAAEGYTARPALLQVDADELDQATLEECFGPLAVLARYQENELLGVLDRLPASLTATIHVEPGDDEHAARLSAALRPKAGRLLFNGWPTGVLVAWAQHHGGPWPSTNSLQTSVGPTAIRRFLRPMTWQNAPASQLPDELRDDATTIPRRIDGILRAGGTTQ